jgi:hypothetical protein
MRPASKTSSRITALLAGAVSFGLWSGIALAQSSSKPGNDLPGVEGDYRIVKPRAEILEPEPDAQPQDGAVKVGDWDVKISGSVIVDIGTMKPRSDR